MSGDILEALSQAISRGDPFVLCTVIQVQGSSPGRPGQKMVVYSDGFTAGTVGGGVNEERVRKAAMELFTGGDNRVLEFRLDNTIASGEPVCGGSMSVFIEMMIQRPRLVIFGGGHIGRALARMAVIAGFRVTLADERPDYASSEHYPELSEVICLPYAEAVDRAAIDTQTFVIIVTPGHRHDREVLARVLKTPARYIGMIGSARKVAETRKTLLNEGTDPQRLNQVHAPVGIYLGCDAPEEIAVSILAQMIGVKNGVVIPFSRP